MEKLFIICHTWKDTDMTIEIFQTNHKAVKYISDKAAEEGFRRADHYEDAVEYLKMYHDWVQSDNDNMCDWVIAMEVVDVSDLLLSKLKATVSALKLAITKLKGAELVPSTIPFLESHVRLMEEDTGAVEATEENKTLLPKPREVGVIASIICHHYFDEINRYGSMNAHDKISELAEKFYEKYKHVTEWEEYCESIGVSDWEELICRFVEETEWN